MSRLSTGYLALLGKAFPQLLVVRVLGSAAAKATATLTEDGTPTAATVTGTGDLSSGALYGGGGTLNGLTVQIAIDNGSTQTCTFSSPANKAAVLSQPQFRRSPTAARTAAQAWLIYDRLRRIAAHFGCRPEDFLKITAYLHDIADLPVIEAIAGTVFVHEPPALTVLQPAGLSLPGARVQIDAVILSRG